MEEPSPPARREFKERTGVNLRELEYPFDSEWVRVYQALEELKKGKTVADTREIEKKAYITVYEKSENDELAGYISDDFGLIADSKRLGYSDKWLEKLISCYENARIPCGEL